VDPDIFQTSSKPVVCVCRPYGGVLDGGVDPQKEMAVLGVNLGHPIITNGDFATRLFPNFGQDLLQHNETMKHKTMI